MPDEMMQAGGAPAPRPDAGAHSLAPWTIERRLAATWIHGTLGETIACVLFPDHPIGQANAQVIVAVPELLAAAWAGARYSNALRRLQDAGINGRFVDATPELERLFLDWHDKTHAAIAKAEGRS